jgi:hypothetical protein
MQLWYRSRWRHPAHGLRGNLASIPKRPKYLIRAPGEHADARRWLETRGPLAHLTRINATYQTSRPPWHMNKNKREPHARD